MIAKLEMLIALAQERHFGRAAARLGITQPSLSTGIKQLEAQLGVQLVWRGSRFGGLTPEGERALEWARRIVGDSRRLRDDMRFSREGLAGHLRLAVIPTALTWAARLAAGFAARHPKVRFTVLSRTSEDVLEMLENLEIDAGLTYLDNEPLGRVDNVFLFRETYMLVCRRDHPLAAREALTWVDLTGHALGLLTPDMQNRRIIDAAFAQAGCAPTVGIESNSTVVLAGLVRQGAWATILPPDMAAFLAGGDDLMSVPVAGPAPDPAVGLIAPAQAPHRPIVQALLDEARELGSN